MIRVCPQRSTPCFNLLVTVLFHPLRYRIKLVLCASSFSGRPYFSFPRAMLFIKKVIFLANVRIVCKPSASWLASPCALPWILFQYWLYATGILEMVKNLFSSSKVALNPPLLAATTLAPTFMLLSKCVL